MKVYVISLLIIQAIIWVAGNIFKMKNELLPEMVLMLTIIVVVTYLTK